MNQKARRPKTTPRKTLRKPGRGRGGQRAGAGRPQEKLPEQLLEELGVPPTDPLDKAAWWGRLLEVLQLGVLKGRPWTTMMRDARANAVVAIRMIPEEIKAAALDALERDEDERTDEVSPAETPREVANRAPNATPALRRDPT